MAAALCVAVEGTERPEAPEQGGGCWRARGKLVDLRHRAHRRWDDCRTGVVLRIVGDGDLVGVDVGGRLLRWAALGKLILGVVVVCGGGGDLGARALVKLVLVPGSVVDVNIEGGLLGRHVCQLDATVGPLAHGVHDHVDDRRQCEAVGDHSVSVGMT